MLGIVHYIRRMKIYIALTSDIKVNTIGIIVILMGRYMTQI
nr:MAG TPA_asm: hypothetical protein [Caudoviricetes sp.]